MARVASPELTTRIAGTDTALTLRRVAVAGAGVSIRIRALTDRGTYPDASQPHARGTNGRKCY